jgi:signal transduction histidine kinase
MADQMWARWILGLLVFSAALLFTLLSAPLKETSPFALFIGATVLSSWYGGAALGLAVASAGAVAVIFAPLYSTTLSAGLVPLGAFVGVALLITWIDVQRRRAEDSLDEELAVEHEGRHEAEAASRAQEDFFATISHELGGPLAAIRSWVYLLQKGQLDEESAVRALESVARNVQAEARLVSEMLDVSRIIAGKVLLDLRPVELAAIVEQAVDSARPAAEASGIQLDTELARGPGAVVGDSDRIAQVVRNLLSNAIKFTPRGGRVAIRLGGDAQRDATITVRDTGQGIRPDFLTHVFDRFRQDGSPALRRAQGGLGLGLAIVRDLVELHGGTVRAESGGEGEGARFTVTLPVGEWTRTAPTASDWAPRPPGSPDPLRRSTEA